MGETILMHRPIASTTLALAVFVVLLSTPVLLSQDATGRVLGSVTDPTGASIAGAKITVINSATGVTRETVTDNEGNFQVLQLPIGTYRVTAEHAGFNKGVTGEEKLLINQSLRFDLRLAVGGVSETVQVEAQVSTVETVSAALGQSVTSRPVVNLPLNGRNVLDLALLQPGVTPSSPRSGSAGTFSVAGGKSDSVTFLLDGGLNNNLLSNGVVFNPNPDTVAEFRILTSNYSAEYGRNGSGILSVVTKSGTNDYHGSVFEFVRNDAFNANLFFNNANGTPRPILKRNQFGASVGGPITIPKIVHGKDRLFFFGGWQSQRLSSLVQNPAVTTFTPRELSGDFSLSNSARTGPDPRLVSFLQQFPYFQPNPALGAQGIIDPGRINTIAKNYTNAKLIPTSPTGLIFPQGGERQNNDEAIGKLDFVITDKDRVAATLGGGRAPRLRPFSAEANVPGFPTNDNVHRYFGNIAYTRIFSTAVLNDVRFTAQRHNQVQAVPAVTLPKPVELGIDITPDNPTGPPQLRFASGLRIGFSRGGPTTLINNTYSVSDNLSWTKGRHTWKYGFFYSPYQNNTVYDFYINGRFRFDGTNGRGSRNDLADFLLGLPDRWTQFPEAPSDIRSKSYAGFAQDEWHISRNLVVTLGIRYEYNSPKLDQQGRSFSLVYGQQSTRFVKAPKGLLFPGDAGAPVGANFPDKNDWAPRFGFAWSPSGKSKTSIRGGFGVFYDILKGEDNLQFNGQAPFFGFNSFRIPGITSNPPSEPQNFAHPYQTARVVNTFPSRPPSRDLDFAASGFIPIGADGVYFVDTNLRTPYIYQYNLSVQQELARDLMMEVSYVGSSIHKMTALFDSNPFILGTKTMLFDAQPGVPAGNFSFLDTFGNVVNGHYNSLEASLQKRASNTRFFGTAYFTLAYTYAHGIDNATGFREYTSNVPYYNHGRFRGSSDNDLRQRISFSGGWDLPFDRGGSKGPKRLVRGWSLYPILSWRTGYPLDVYSGIPRDGATPGPSGAGDSQLVHANLVGTTVTTFDPHLNQKFGGSTGNFYFNPANFSVAEYSAPGFDPVRNPAQRTYGTLGRNAFRGPGRTNFDLALAKNTPISAERVKMEFRVEFFNIFNHTQFSDPNLDITTGTFGQITTTADPRIIQFALRLTF
jgi:hypothetical protein